MTRALQVVIALLAVAQALGQGANAQAVRAREVNACTLLTPEEISSAIGYTVSAGCRHDEGLQPDGSYSSTCMWMIEQNWRDSIHHLECHPMATGP